jgi:ATP-dependent Zn protease
LDLVMQLDGSRLIRTQRFYYFLIQKVSEATQSLLDSEARKIVEQAMKRTHEIVNKVS